MLIVAIIGLLLAVGGFMFYQYAQWVAHAQWYDARARLRTLLGEDYR